MEDAGKIIDGSAFMEKTLAIFISGSVNGGENQIEIKITENKSKEKFVILSLKKYPMMKLRGSYPEDNGQFQFTSLEYLAGSTHGWNEYSLQLLGTGRMYLDDLNSQQLAALEITEEIEFASITNARIHRYDTRITGDDALRSLRGRHDRIISLVEWMLTLDHPFDQNIKEFEKNWKPFLFPETALSWDRPGGWRLQGDTYITAEDIRWNTAYTERVFPQELYDVRNSGTLLRDWEEALSWIYMIYEWDNIIKLLSDHNIFLKVRS